MARRMSGQVGMQRVFDTISRELSEANHRLTLAILMVVVAAIFVVFGWLAGTSGTVTYALSLLGLAVAYWVHTLQLRDTLEWVEQRSIDEAERSGFSVQKDGRNNYRYALRVEANSEDWISSQLYTQLYPNSAALKAGTEKAASIIETKQTNVAWSPGDAIWAVRLRKLPEERLSRQDYLLALAGRIDRLIADEEEDDVRSYLAEVETWDSGVNTDKLGGVGLSMIEESLWIEDRCPFPWEGVPVSELMHDEELAEYLDEGDNLSEFIYGLYSGVER